jgi:hypothetical protein
MYALDVSCCECVMNVVVLCMDVLRGFSIGMGVWRERKSCLHNVFCEDFLREPVAGAHSDFFTKKAE